MTNWSSNDGKRMPDRGLKQTFAKLFWDLFRGFQFQFGVIWKV